MTNDDPSLPLLQKLCDLQQQLLDTMSKHSEHLSEIAAATTKSHESYRKQLEEYEEQRRADNERAEVQAKEAKRGQIIAMIILGLIPISIIVAHFL
jgi:hypothetical protein